MNCLKQAQKTCRQMTKSKYRKLDKLYQQIPDIECKGLCHTTCTIIPTGKIEAKRAKERMGSNPFMFTEKKLEEAIKGQKIPPCRALKDQRCTIYNIRPAICRMYGVAEGLDCGFGCKPKQIMSRQAANKLIRDIEDL